MENNYFNQENLVWLKKRLGRFTASEIHKLFVSGKKGEWFGKGAMTYIMSKAAELLTMEVKDEIDFKQGEWGKANERDGVLAFESKIEKNGTHYGMLKPEFFELGKFTGCSPDWEHTSEDDFFGADIKCPFNSAEHVKNLMLNSAADLKEERWEYYCQLQMSIMVRGWSKAYFVSYDPRVVEYQYGLKIIEVYPDEAWQKEFTQRLDAAIEKLNDIVNMLQPA
jgi:YqaJ-like viral recombinase domain